MRWLLLALVGLALAESAAAGPPIVIAHRGRDASTPENTLAAFRHSIAAGITVMETDVRTTKDGEFVLLHDERVDRTTNGHGSIGHLTLVEARKLDAGSGERIPTLREALGVVRGTGASLLLDMKPGTPLEPVLALVRSQHAEQNVYFALRSPEQAAQLHRLAPDIRAVGLIATIWDIDAYRKAGVRIIRLWSQWIDPAAGGDPKLVQQVKARGDTVWCLVGKRLPRSDAEWMATHARLAALGVDAIATDRPDLLRSTY